MPEQSAEHRESHSQLTQTESHQRSHGAGERRHWFRLRQPVPVRWLPLAADELPESEQLAQGLPHALRLGGEIRAQLARLPASQQTIWQLTEQKLDTLLTLLLSQDQAKGHSGTLTEISAAGGRMQLAAPLPVCGYLQLLLLLPEPGYPMVVAAEITRRTPLPDAAADTGTGRANLRGGQTELALRWCRIRPKDQEMLAHCTLSWQSAHLRQRRDNL